MTFKSPTPPMAHQIEAVKRALKKPVAFAYMGETGTGKSAMPLLEYQHRYNLGDIRDLLIVAPAGSIRNWYTDKAEDQLAQLKLFLDPRFYKQLVFADNGKRAANRHARDKVFKSNGSQPRALFVNIEALSRGRDTDAEIMCREFLRAGPAMMVIDESTRIRHHGSKRSRAVIRLGSFAKSRRIMSGLIVPRSPLDLFNQMNFLDQRILGFSSFVAFRARYAKMRMINVPAEGLVDLWLKRFLVRKRIRLDTTGWLVKDKVQWMLEQGAFIEGAAPIITGYQNLDELRQKYLPYCFTIWKKDCLDLKPKVYEPRDVELTKEQKRMYQEMKEEAYAELEGREITANSVLAQMTRLHQIVCGHSKTTDGDIIDIPSNRIQDVLDELEEYDGKAILWCIYDREIRKIGYALHQAYGADSYAMYWGGNRKTRDDDEKRFLSSPKCRFMISSQPTGGIGNTWNVAKLSLYVCNSHDLEHRIQSEDRNHRKGQTESVTYIDFIARGTVDEKIIYALRRKLDLASIITGGNYKEWLI